MNQTFSNELEKNTSKLVLLVGKLNDIYPYVSCLGTDIRGNAVYVDRMQKTVTDSNLKEYGYVLKIYNGISYKEYSFNEINDIDELILDIKEKITIPSSLEKNTVNVKVLKDEPLNKTFERPNEGSNVTIPEVVNYLCNLKDEIIDSSNLIVNVRCSFEAVFYSKIFVSKNRLLKQFYTWTNGMAMVVVKNEKGLKYAYQSTYGNNMHDALYGLKEKAYEAKDLAIKLLDSTTVKPGVYDCITAPSISGLIAHEAFGHGVEMDMFVKNRALAKDYIGKYVASELVSMHDGASAYHSAASYFFDDEGVLAHDTLIIKNGVLQTGISDSLSALQLNSEPTGNGRRESFRRKAYTRMTNTFFEPGNDKLEDMIKSIKHGYLLEQTSNGMEDPKNWNIQCVAQYGLEIKDGKLTGNMISPVVMSGYVPDLLKSISMVSDGLEVIGSGSCGKGHKEWVRVSDGGPYLKARVKLG